VIVADLLLRNTFTYLRFYENFCPLICCVTAIWTKQTRHYIPIRNCSFEFGDKRHHVSDVFTSFFISISTRHRCCSLQPSQPCHSACCNRLVKETDVKPHWLAISVLTTITFHCTSKVAKLPKILCVCNDNAWMTMQMPRGSC